MINITQLKKLRGRSLKEFRVRGAQEISKLGERALRISEGEMSDATLAREIKPEHRLGSIAETAQRIMNWVEYPAVEDRFSARLTLSPSVQRQKIVDIMERRFSDQREALVNSARRAIGGEFDLLGFNRISFGNPIDWHLEPIAGKRAPLDHWSRIAYLDPQVAGDKKIIWELNRHQHFVTFGQAYWMTEDESFAEAFVSQARSWMDANPPKRGINWTSSLEVALRCISWIWALRLLEGSGSLTQGFLLRVLKNIVTHGCHIESYLSHYFSPNTHLTGEALGLLYLGVAFPELRRAGMWRKLGVKILIEQLSRQARSDGVYFEQSTYYHRYTADFYTHLLLLARANSIRLPAMVEEKLAQMLDYVMWITHPSGSSPLIGDDDGGRLIKLGERDLDDFRDTLATGAALFGRGDWKYVSGGAAVETLWLAGPEGLARYDELESKPPEATARAFRESGYYVMRDGWSPGSSYVISSCNPQISINCAHAHADALSLEFAALGKTWFLDPGTFTYTGDAGLRDWFRQTKAHNTATVDRESQSAPCGPFSWRDRTNAQMREFISEEIFDYFEGSHDGYERLPDPVTHTRSILFAKAPVAKRSSRPAYLVVHDRFTAQSNHYYEIRYHIHSDCDVRIRGNQVEVIHPDGDSLSISVFGASRVQARIEEGWVSRAYGHRQSSLTVVFSAEGEACQHFTTLIIPSKKGQQ